MTNTADVKPIKGGLDFYRGSDWQPLRATRAGAMRLALRRMPEDLKRAKFHAVVADCGGFWRILYGK